MAKMPLVRICENVRVGRAKCCTFMAFPMDRCRWKGAEFALGTKGTFLKACLCSAPQTNAVPSLLKSKPRATFGAAIGQDAKRVCPFDFAFMLVVMELHQAGWMKRWNGLNSFRSNFLH
jgi:hypothetical protein